MEVYKRFFVLLNLMVFVIGGCAHLPGAGKSEKALRERVTKEWEAKIKGDWGSVYDLTTKAFKSQVKREKYAAGTNIEVKSYVVTAIEMDATQEKAWAQIVFDITFMAKPFKGAKTKEEWIWEDGEWRLNLDPRKTPFK